MMHPLWRRLSLRGRLLTWLIGPLALLACAVSVQAFFSVSRTSEQLHDRTLQTVLLTLSEHMLANDNELVAENLLEVLTESLGDQFFYHFAAPGNAWVIGYSGVPDVPPDIAPGNGRIAFYDGIYQGDPVRAVVSRQLARLPGLDGWTTLTVWQRVQQRRALALELFASSLWRLALLVGAAGLITWWAVTRGLRPLDDLRRAVAKRSPEDLSPIRRPVPAELQPIVATMNALFARVSDAGLARERLIADAAHQLRNPVAALRTQAQNLVSIDDGTQARQRLATLLESTERLGRLVDQMLVSARSNAGPVPMKDSVDLVSLARKVAREHGGRAVTKGQELSFENGARSARVSGNADLLRELLANLVDNAIVHNDPGTNIQVDVSTEDATVKISVSDTGRILDAVQLEELTAPFHTGDHPSAGSGLGLSIVADIVQLHGGSFDVHTAQRGNGKTLSVSLPLDTTTPSTPDPLHA